MDTQIQNIILCLEELRQETIETDGRPDGLVVIDSITTALSLLYALQGKENPYVEPADVRNLCEVCNNEWIDKPEKVCGYCRERINNVIQGAC